MSRRAAQYVRMSSDQQPLSIDAQKEAISRYATAHGIDIVRTYADEAKSGVILGGRGGMQQLLEDVMGRDKTFEEVLVLDMTRWGRFQDVDESAYYEYHCRKHGVQVRYVAEPFEGATSPFTSLLKPLKRAMAAEFSRELAHKTRAAQIQAVNMGFATGLLPCLGYRRQAVAVDSSTRLLAAKERKPHVTDHVRWVLADPSEVEIVRSVFRKYAEGVPLAQIARDLDCSEVRTHAGKKVTVICIQKLLSNEIVIGNFVWGTRGPSASVTHIARLPESLRNSTMVRAIVDVETWNRVQARTAETAARRVPGARRDALVEKLRQALNIKPWLNQRDFPKFGFTCREVQRHFGNLAEAFAAAREARAMQSSAALRMPTQKIAKHLFRDLSDLLQQQRVQFEADLCRQNIQIGPASVKVRVAAQIRAKKDQAWQMHRLPQRVIEGRWLLLMRLNSDHLTGKDFILLPPGMHENFTGFMGPRRGSSLGDYTFTSTQELVQRLRLISRYDDPGLEELRWSG